MGGVVAAWRTRNGFEGGWYVAEDGAFAGDAGSSVGVGEAEEGDVEAVRANGGSFKGGGGAVGVDLDEADKEVHTGSEETVRDDIVGKELHDGCFEGADVLFAESCGHRGRKGGAMQKRDVRDRVGGGAAEVNEGRSLL